jgi:hypothetical protein
MRIYYVDYPVKNKRYTRKMQHNIARKLAREQRKIDRYFMEHYALPPNAALNRDDALKRLSGHIEPLLIPPEWFVPPGLEPKIREEIRTSLEDLNKDLQATWGDLLKGVK